jgi:Tfp pilus assembly protein PilO
VSAARPFWRRRLLPAFLGLAALNLLVFVVWTGPRTFRLRSVAVRGATARAEVERQRETVGRLRERAEAIRANQADLERFYRTVAGTEKADLLPMLAEIEELARRPGLTPGARNFKRAEVPNARLERVAVTLPLEGSYGQLLGFLRATENSERFLTIDRVSMRTQGERGEAALQVELSSYLRVAPGEKEQRKVRGR